MSKVHLIYASTTGNTEAVMEKIAQQLTQAGYTPELHRSENTQIDTIMDNELFILGVSTWSQGIINPFFDDLLAQIVSGDMNGKIAAFVGLGDKYYTDPHFNKGIDTLQESFLKAGGKAIHTTLKIDGDPHAILDTDVVEWTSKLITALKDSVPPS